MDMSEDSQSISSNETHDTDSSQENTEHPQVPTDTKDTIDAVDAVDANDLGDTPEVQEAQEWINLFNKKVVPRQVLEHAILFDREGSTITIDTMDLLAKPLVLNFDSQKEAIEAIQHIHEVLLSENVVFRAFGEDT